MTREERNYLIEKCLSKRKNIDLDKAYELAVMAIYDQSPDDNFTEDEYFIWLDYRLIVLNYQIEKGDSA